MLKTFLQGRAGSEKQLEQIWWSRAQTAQLVSAQGTTLKLERSGPLLGGMLVELWHVAVLRSVKGLGDEDRQSRHLWWSSEQSAQSRSLHSKTLFVIRSGPKPTGMFEVSRHELLLSNRYLESVVGVHRVQTRWSSEQTSQLIVLHVTTSFVERFGPLVAGMFEVLWQMEVDLSMNFFGLLTSHAAQVR